MAVPGASSVESEERVARVVTAITEYRGQSMTGLLRQDGFIDAFQALTAHERDLVAIRLSRALPTDFELFAGNPPNVTD